MFQLNSMVKKSLGVCVGASTVSFVELKKDGDKIELLNKKSVSHDGNPKKIIRDFFNNFKFDGHSIVATGRKFKKAINFQTVSEPEAVEKAFKYLNFEGIFETIASLGGENFIIYCLNKKGDIINAIAGNKCASGTGEFFLQQIRRMNLPLEEAVRLSKNQKPYFVSGRCSVFCKSDCTHALNKGIPKEEVTAGLCKMIANKAVELLSKQKTEKILVIGGVSQNQTVIDFLRRQYGDNNIYIPEQATYFEAFGAALIGFEKTSKTDLKNLFLKNLSNFSFFEPLEKSKQRVAFKTMEKDQALPNDICILGLDVGSTTTKAVIVREKDNSLLASVYLRTNGNPIQASVDCYKELKKQIKEKIKIIGLGVTGSGRHIAGLHGLTKGIINEIIAHAVAAAHFDKDVDTIFEIGGQDAKYTHLTNGVASDYAMNEACSAGTGSFLEESAKETLGIDYREIADFSLKAGNPPNFNDQCAAFISSDIKNASQENISIENIVAGLVYSIAMNYLNRVKGNRPVGNKIFMQGGTCYNKAVPIAMAALLNKDIVVPPEPGIIGAYGAALEIKNRLNLGLIEEKEFDLDDLINREFKYENGFICPGKPENCDRHCQIAIMEVAGKKYPFGGACNKYYNQRLNIIADTKKNDYVKIRQDLVFDKYAPSLPSQEKNEKTIGINKSFISNTFYPLYYNFFAKLGFRVALSDTVDPAGIDKIMSSFCYPVEISHGLFQNLINKKPDYIFLPHITQLANQNESCSYKKLCVFAQAEPYYLKSAFGENCLPPIISPVIDFSQPKEKIIRIFEEIALILKKRASDGRKAFLFADQKQQEMFKEFKESGRKILEELEKDKNNFAMVLFGRPYNGFAKEGNLGIPHKFASKNIPIIPYDFLDIGNFPSYRHMYWHSGQQILSAARLVASHPQLFGVYITNFSCGPDSFIISYFRKIMSSKPSLTLELDSHSADVGIDTRIDAALDIIRNYRQLQKNREAPVKTEQIKPLTVLSKQKKIFIIGSDGKKLALTSPEIEVLFPSMGRFGTQALVAAFKHYGVNAKAMPIPTMKTLKTGRNYSNCKECLPFILTTGSMIEYVLENKNNNKKILFFMPHGGGPCRQGQYHIKLQDIINEQKLDNVGILSLNDENSYGGLSLKFYLLAWLITIISDAMQDIENALLALAIDRDKAIEILENEWKKFITEVENPDNGIIKITGKLKIMAKKLSEIKLKQKLKDAKVISLIGEAYVRREEFSRIDLIKILADNGFVTKAAPVNEYFYYCNYLTIHGYRHDKVSLFEKIETVFKNEVQKIIEKRVKKILAVSGLASPHLTHINEVLAHSEGLIRKDLLGEAILTVGSGLKEIIEQSCGVISIGPFACMPSRLAEAILNKEMARGKKTKSNGKNNCPAELNFLPYLHIETDGNPYPQIIQSKLEIFMLQAEKLHKILNCKK